MLKATDLWRLEGFELGEWIASFEYPWEVLAHLGALLADRVKRDVRGEVHPSAVIEGEVVIERGAVVEPMAFIQGPTIIKEGAQVRHGAYIRGDVYVGEGAIVGHATEVKNSLLLPKAGAPHFNYVGDSVLGRESNLGAGSKLSNFKVTKTGVKVRTEEGLIDTGLRKFGALIGDEAQLGCNVVLNPGTIVGPRTLVYLTGPGSEILPADSIIRLELERRTTPRR